MEVNPNFAKPEKEKPISPLPIDEQTIFTNYKGDSKSGVKKQQLKYLEKVKFVKAFLEDDEKILQVTIGCSPMSFLEQYLTGWVIFYLKRCWLVFTDRRVLHIPTTSTYKYRGSIAQIRYGDCEKLYIKGRTLVAKYKNGMTEKFYYVGGKQKKKIKLLLEGTALSEYPGVNMERTHLCPCCGEVLVKDKFSCDCGQMFKDKAAARKWSILVPGGGYFYTGHYFFGVLDFIAEAYLTLLFITVVVGMVRGELDAGVVIFVGVLLLLEKLISVYHSNHYVKEFIPQGKLTNVCPPEIVLSSEIK